MARKTEIALLLETQSNLLQATSQNGRDGEGFSGRYFLFLLSSLGFRGYTGGFLSSRIFSFAPLSFCTFYPFLGVGFLYRN